MPRLVVLLVALWMSAAATAAVAADREAPAIDAVAADVLHQADGHRLLILGDMHGTREVPLLVGDVVERIARREAVTLALEMPRTEQAALDAALHARDPAHARRLLLARPWWRRSDDQHDGRRSLDMIDLVARIGTLRRAGRDVALLAYDIDEGAAPASPGERDRIMATRIRAAYRAAPTRRLVMLTGNVHAFLRMPSYMQWPAPITMAGMRLANLDPASLRIGATSGQAWGCVARTCRAIPAHPAGVPAEGEYTGAVDLPRLHVGRLVTVTPARP